MKLVHCRFGVTCKSKEEIYAYFPINDNKIIRSGKFG